MFKLNVGSSFDDMSPSLSWKLETSEDAINEDPFADDSPFHIVANNLIELSV